MKRILISFFLFFPLKNYSQQAIKVHYTSYFNVSKATEEIKKTQPDYYNKLMDEEMMAKMLRFSLDIQNNTSLFYLQESLISDLEDPIVKNYVVGEFYGLSKIYVDKNKDTLVEQLNWPMGKFLKNKKASFIEWEITTETKEINGYQCFKANYVYSQPWRDRIVSKKVEAWYCPVLPYSFGPIRYNGLPGLILELHEKDITFVVEKIEFLKKDLKITQPTDGEIYNHEEMSKKFSRIKENLKGG